MAESTTTTTLAPVENNPGGYPEGINSKEEKRMYDRTGIIALDLPTSEEQLLVIKPYKVYIALVSQGDAVAPVVKVLENTIGEIVWSYDSAGSYSGTIDKDVFDANKTFVSISNSNDINTVDTVAYTNGSNSIVIETTDGENYVNNMLSDAALEIRVYDTYTIAPTV